MYDDSDGWYDHQMPPIVNPSFNNTIISGKRVDILNGGGICNYSGTGATGNGNQQGTGPTPMFPLNGTYAARMNGRCALQQSARGKPDPRPYDRCCGSVKAAPRSLVSPS